MPTTSAATTGARSPAHRGIPEAESVLFEESSHMAFVEEPEQYRAVLTGFLDRAEAA
jgi:L-proline amide hydrolase